MTQENKNRALFEVLKYPDAVQLLLNMGANPFVETEYDQKTPHEVAIYERRVSRNINNRRRYDQSAEILANRMIEMREIWKQTLTEMTEEETSYVSRLPDETIENI